MRMRTTKTISSGAVTRFILRAVFVFQKAAVGVYAVRDKIGDVQRKEEALPSHPWIPPFNWSYFPNYILNDLSKPHMRCIQLRKSLNRFCSMVINLVNSCFEVLE